MLFRISRIRISDLFSGFLILPLINLSRLGAIGWADDSVFLEDVEQTRGAGVADRKTALEQGGGSLACLQNVWSVGVEVVNICLYSRV